MNYQVRANISSYESIDHRSVQVQEKDVNATPPLVRSQLEPQLEAVVLEKVR
jgi:hypothetical protein